MTYDEQCDLCRSLKAWEARNEETARQGESLRRTLGFSGTYLNVYARECLDRAERGRVAHAQELARHVAAAHT